MVVVVIVIGIVCVEGVGVVVEGVRVTESGG